MNENAGRVLGQRLVESGDLLVDVIFRRAGIGGLAAELLAGLLEHFIDREPVFDARDHDVHDVFFTGLAAERIFRVRAGRRRRKASMQGPPMRSCLEICASFLLEAEAPPKYPAAPQRLPMIH